MSNDQLANLFAAGSVTERSGTTHDLGASVRPEFAFALRDVAAKYAVDNALEIGMANGVTTLAILTGAPQSRVVSIDPVQTQQYKEAGLVTLEQAGVADRHRLVQDYDYNALPALLSEGRRFDLTYIDGWHTFDYTLLDVFYADKMTPAGGVIGFNDCNWPSVHRVCSWLLRHRRYDEIDVGLERYDASTTVKTLGRRVLRRPTADRYFVKREDWEPNYNFWAAF